MTLRDAGPVAALSRQLGYPCAASEMRRRIRDLGSRGSSALLVAQSAEGDLIGWAHVEGRYILETGPFAELTGLVVDENARGRGVGRALVAAAEAWARARGHRTLRVRSNTKRTPARVFYERLGYAVVKTQNVFERGIRSGARRSEGTGIV